jgi:predicted transcriptional regulator of viral defense system
MHSKSVLKRGLGELEGHALSQLAAVEKPVVRAADLAPVIERRAAANLMLSRLARKGWLLRLRRGAYSVVPLASDSGAPNIEDPLAVAMRIFAPCYISGWTAAHHWDLTEQVFNSVVVYSAKRQRHAAQTIGGARFQVRSVRPETIFGTTKVWSGTVPVNFATIHRTVIDVLDAPDMGGGGRQSLDIMKAYWSKPEANPDELFELALRLGRGSIFKRLGFTGELFGRARPAWLEACRSQLTAGVSLLDPAGPSTGRIVTRWRLRLNIPLDPAQ